MVGRWWSGFVLAAVLLAGAGCVEQSPPPTAAAPDRDVIVVGAFNFPESRVLAELYAQALAGAGFPVEVLPLGSREILEPALEQGFVDLVPEYTGSALNFLERRSDAADSDAERTYLRLETAFADRGVTLAAGSPAENQNAFVVRRETAQTLGLETVSDLADVAGELTLGGPPECPERPACGVGLRERYDVSFGRFIGLTHARHVAAALAAGEVDVGLLFTTDPVLADHDLVALIDDRGLQPAEQVVPVIRDATLARFGAELLAVVDRVSRALSTAELAALNHEMVAEDAAPDAIAREWLAAHQLTP
jgi:osmoprotectant transport system substrate-binding protein